MLYRLMTDQQTKGKRKSQTKIRLSRKESGESWRETELLVQDGTYRQKTVLQCYRNRKSSSGSGQTESCRREKENEQER